MTAAEVLREVSARLDAIAVLLGRCELRLVLGEDLDGDVIAALNELNAGVRFWMVAYRASCPPSEGPDR